MELVAGYTTTMGLTYNYATNTGIRGTGWHYGIKDSMKVKQEEVTDVFCDGDVWCYRLAFSSQHEPPETPAPWFTIKWAIHETLDKVSRRYPNAKIHICLTDEHKNYRKAIAVTALYKGGRISTKPYWWRKVRDWFMADPRVNISVNEEADDVMSKKLMESPYHVCCTVDKDLKNTPGSHWNDRTGAHIVVTPAMAYRNFYMQLLTGDQVDNIKGCPRIGKAKAETIVRGCKTPEEYECAVGLAYACSKPVDDPEGRMVEMGRLLWMRRLDDEMWDLRANGFTTKEHVGA